MLADRLVADAGDVGPALRNFQVASGLAGADPVVLRQLGNAAVEAGQFWLASDALDRAVTANPTSAPTWIDKARADRARGQIRRARQSYTRALELEPTNEVIRQELDELAAPPE